MQDAFHASLFDKLVLHCDNITVPVLARKASEFPQTLHTLLHDHLPMSLKISQDRFWRLLRNSFTTPLAQWRPRVNGVQHRVWMRVQLASTDSEWLAVRTVLSAYASHLLPFITVDALMHILQSYAQQMATWWRDRNNKRALGPSRYAVTTDSDDASGMTEHSGTSGETPPSKRVALHNVEQADTPHMSKGLLVDEWGNEGGSLGWGPPISANCVPCPSLPMSMPIVCTPPTMDAVCMPTAHNGGASGPSDWLHHEPTTPAMPSWWGASANAVATQQGLPLNSSKLVHLNVGGTSFTTTVRTLMAVPGTFFTELLQRVSSRVETATPPTLFVDRSPQLFTHVLDFLRHCSLHPPLPPFHKQLPRDQSKLHMLLSEARFYQLPDLVTNVVHALLHPAESDSMQYSSVFSETGYWDSADVRVLQQKQESTLGTFNAALAMQQRAGWQVESVQPTVFAHESNDGKSMRSLAYHALLKRSSGGF